MSEQNTNDQKELERLDKFVEAAPQNSYNIDQYKQQLCRQLPGGQEECLKLNLECKISLSIHWKEGSKC